MEETRGRKSTGPKNEFSKMTLGEKINYFDSLEDNSVRKFNEIFSEFPIERIDLDNEVEIGEILVDNTNSIRTVKVNGMVFSHQFNKLKNRGEKNDWSI